MADDRWLQWQAEAAGTNKLPGIWSVFLVLGLLACLALALAAGPTATAQSGERSQGRCATSTAASRPGSRSAPTPGAARARRRPARRGPDRGVRPVCASRALGVCASAHQGTQPTGRATFGRRIHSIPAGVPIETSGIGRRVRRWSW
jgi:hypothetical protein